MIIEFAAADAARAGVVARFVVQDGLPADADVLVKGAAAAAPFTGKAGQLFEAMVPAGAGVQRLAFAGIGEAGAAGRTAATLERAGGALAGEVLSPRARPNWRSTLPGAA
jgi:leucyl aminopeptidase